MANPRTTNAPMAPNFAQVATFCSIAPHRNPTTLIQVTTTIMSKAATCARVTTIPAIDRTVRDCEIAGTIPPRYAAEPTDKAADRAAIAHAEHRPAIKKCRQVAVRFAHIHILAAGVGEHRAQLREGE